MGVVFPALLRFRRLPHLRRRSAASHWSVTSNSGPLSSSSAFLAVPLSTTTTPRAAIPAAEIVDTIDKIEIRKTGSDPVTVELGDDAHPNSATFDVSRGEDRIAITGCSIGGGRIRVLEIDGFAVDLSGSLPAIVVVADDNEPVMDRFSQYDDIATVIARGDIGLAACGREVPVA